MGTEGENEGEKDKCATEEMNRVYWQREREQTRERKETDKKGDKEREEGRKGERQRSAHQAVTPRPTSEREREREGWVMVIYRDEGLHCLFYFFVFKLFELRAPHSVPLFRAIKNRCSSHWAPRLWSGIAAPNTAAAPQQPTGCYCNRLAHSSIRLNSTKEHWTEWVLISTWLFMVSSGDEQSNLLI